MNTCFTILKSRARVKLDYCIYRTPTQWSSRPQGFLRWLRVKGCCPNTPSGSKNASGPVSIPPPKKERLSCQAINLALLERVRAQEDGPPRLEEYRPRRVFPRFPCQATVTDVDLVTKPHEPTRAASSIAGVLPESRGSLEPELEREPGWLTAANFHFILKVDESISTIA